MISSLHTYIYNNYSTSIIPCDIYIYNTDYSYYISGHWAISRDS